MREILFRGKKQNGEWLQGDLVHYGDKILIFSENAQNSPDYYEVEPETVGQFIGLTDKNGVKIFEGDILSCCKKASLYKNFPIEIIGIVFFHKGIYEVETKKVINKQFSNQSSIFFGVQPMDWIHLPEFHKSEIIGSIHENPELLK